MKPAKFSAWDVAYALDMSVACGISYWVITHAGISILDMWAAVSTVFVFR